MALIDAELAGLDHLELAAPPRPRVWTRVWAAAWPKLAAVAIALGIWQLVVWSGWKPEFVLPAPATVFDYLFSHLGEITEASVLTLQRGIYGFLIATVIGTLLGMAVARSRVLRSALGSMITGLQTMPSIAWFPAAILLFQLTQGAILFVVVLGAAPSIANGLITGVDHVNPVLLRAGRTLGAKGFSFMRHVVLPAALPAYVAGLKQGWAFAWRSLLAGELLVIIPGKTSLGQQLQVARDLVNAPYLYSIMIAILVIGILVDAVGFAALERWVRRRYGLVDAAAE